MSRDLSAITAPWRANALGQGLLFGLAVLAASAALFSFQRRQRASLDQAALAQTRLHESEVLFRTLFERSSEALLLLADGRFVDCNEASLAMLGLLDKSQLLGRSPAEFSPEYQPDGRRSEEKAEDLIAQTEEGGTHHFEWTHLRASGEPFIAEVGLSRIRLGGRLMLHVAWRDITRRAEQERIVREARDLLEITVAKRTEELSGTVAALREARDQAESAGRMKIAFLAGVSHELRTPLNPVLGMLQLLLDQSPRPDQMEFLQGALSGAERLLSMVNDLIELTGLEDVKAATAPIGLDGVLDLFRREIGAKARAKGLDLTTTLAPDSPDIITTDLNLLRRMLLNLGDNAVKFTIRGSVGLTVSVSRTGAGRGLACFAVSDTGIGLAPDKVEAVAAGLTQGETGLARQYGGLGLGLATVRKCLDILEGTLEVESTPGQGSIFRLWLPVHFCSREDLSACLLG